METKPRPKTGLALFLLLALIVSVTLGAKYAYDRWVQPTMAGFSTQYNQAKDAVEQGQNLYHDYQKLKDSGLIEDVQGVQEDVKKYKP